MSDPSHFKRYRMERPLAGLPEPPAFPPGYWAAPWQEHLLQLHADVKAACFRDDLDGRLFPNLADPLGCRDLMASIRGRAGFCPAATWLLAGPAGYCGTVQGIVEAKRIGAIQNLGIAPEHRGLGLGKTLLLLALSGFARAGARTCALEVSADNVAAVELYLRFGFRRTRVFYRRYPAVPEAVGIQSPDIPRFENAP